MRQVPHYCLIGDGRVATHFHLYFRSLKLPFNTWSRRHNSIESLPSILSKFTHALVPLSIRHWPAYSPMRVARTSRCRKICCSDQVVSLMHAQTGPTSLLRPRDIWWRCFLCIDSFSISNVRAVVNYWQVRSLILVTSEHNRYILLAY